MGGSSVGHDIVAGNAGWVFGGDVPKSFDDHVGDSVPLYHEGHRLIFELSDFFLMRSSTIYDVGSSTGTLLHQLGERHQGKSLVLVGIDSEKEMVDFSRLKVSGSQSPTFVHADVEDFTFEACDMVVSYYTLQFVRPKFRQMVVDNIYRSLNWGGAFVLFEKVRANDARFQDILTALYTEFKLSKGFSGEEVVAKARSLKGVLEPFSSQANLDMLKRAGFTDVVSISKFICFEGFLAIK